MLDQRKRKILYYDMVIHSLPEDAPKFTFKETQELLEECYNSAKAFKFIKLKTAAVRIRALHVNNVSKVITLLVNYADKNISDPVFSQLETGTLREEPKLEGEGVAMSAHLAISMKPNSTGEHIAVMEYIPGLSRGIIQPFLNSLLRKESTYTFKDANRSTKKCRPKVEFEALEGQSLKDDLDQGTLRGLELVKYKVTAKDLDKIDGVVPVSSNIAMHVKRDYSGSAAVAIIKRVIGYGKEQGFSDVKVRIKDKYGKERTVLTGVSRSDAANILYGKHSFVTTRSNIKQCTNTINEEIRNDLERIILAQR